MSYSKTPRSAAGRGRKIASAIQRPISFEPLEGRTMLSTVSINTDTQTITGPFNSGTIYGVPYTSALVNNVAVFTVKGNLSIPSGDSVIGTGHYPAELLVGGDVQIGAGASVSFVSGGGTGGASVQGGAGGTAGVAGAGGSNGGGGGGGFDGNGNDGGAGQPSAMVVAANNGGTGVNGAMGNAGQPAFATISGGGFAGGPGGAGFGGKLTPTSAQGAAGSKGGGGGFDSFHAGSGGQVEEARTAPRDRPAFRPFRELQAAAEPMSAPARS